MISVTIVEDREPGSYEHKSPLDDPTAAVTNLRDSKGLKLVELATCNSTFVEA
ncbi:hypothetical protein M378DRAFT_163275 [Amanita muscaria Koide BX008]|uniref:Uncharacterized protein n=1 Tax=Amanita muscaria (strain Koide BX008) TaxID=946122 RepID=A0A0C2X5G6_AMAMK|nr:hypothetical protein M378DRAFT_163275 [Amanita muscaria Koide BX008]